MGDEKKPKFIYTPEGIAVGETADATRDEDERRRKELKEKKRQKEYEEACKRYDIKPITFSNFVISVSTATLVHFGELPDPVTGKRERNLFLARQNIDLLGMIREKTKGNLTAEEQRVLDDALFKLRLRYVELCKQEQAKETEKGGETDAQS